MSAQKTSSRNRRTRSSGNSNRTKTAVTPLHAAAIHHAHAPSQALIHERVRAHRRQQPTSGRGQFWRDAALALLLAAGMSSVFLNPIRPSVPSTATLVSARGRVLGASVRAPLRVTVVVQSSTTSWRTEVEPVHGTLVEALALAAQHANWQFRYVSRGSSMYLQQFGIELVPWTVRLNGVTILDLTQETLQQGDTITLE